MITDCFSGESFGWSGELFVADVGLMLIVIAPAAIVFTLWRIFVTNKKGPRGGVEILGLDDSAFVYSDLRPNAMPISLRILYLTTTAVTFIAGVLATEVARFIGKLFTSQS